jgi:hypothetical protein
LCETSVFVLFPAFTARRFCLPGAVLVWEIGIATASPPGQRRGSEAMHEDGERRPSSPQLLTAYCVDIDPHKPCMYGWLSKIPSAGAYVRIMHCGSTTLKSAVFTRLRGTGILRSSSRKQENLCRSWRLNQLLAQLLAHPKRLTHRPHTPYEHEDPQQKR